ncbi:armadillo repeat-containing protein 7-like [Mytilus edulis]|uniref:armadillo repeat-containing protein 7-like n=1 Tax=Mytilus edulis TaxID=6550 RepID=UPI0039EF9A19
MFSTKEQLDKRTGPYGIGRLSYLQSLVTEYQDTNSLESKQQVLANLANFAYDPVNYDYFRTLNVLDLFLDAIEETDDQLVEFAVGGICNCCLDKENKEYILKNNGVQLVIKCLSSSNEETVLSAITTLMYLTTPNSKTEICSVPVVECMLRFSQASNKRIGNLAKVFLQDYCTKQQKSEALKIQAQFSYQENTT